VTRLVAVFLSTVASSSLLGCALTSKSDPTLLRYYSMGSPLPRTRGSSAASASTKPAQARLRIGRVSAALYIRERMAFRESDLEIGYYDDFRWTERPESYVRRDLARALFEDEGVGETVGGGGLTLDVDLERFEEVRQTRLGVVQLSWQLRDETVVLLRQTVHVQRPLAASENSSPHKALAAALSEALEEAIDQIVNAVLPKLAAL